MTDEQPGLRPIGNFLPRTVNSPSASVSTQMPSPTNSATTGSAKAATLPNGTGPQRGATGAGTSLPTMPLDRLLAGADPAKTDAALIANCERLLGQRLASELEDVIDPQYGWDSRVVSYELQFPADEGQLRRAQQLVRDACDGSPPQMVVQELARVRMLTKSRAADETDREASYVAFAEELLEFPPDIVRSALRKIARREVFFPTLAEMRDQCQRGFRHRELIARAIGVKREVHHA